MKKLLMIAIALQASFAMANYVNFGVIQAWGELEAEPGNWEGGLVPSGSTTGVVSEVINGAWADVLHGISIRQTGSYITPASDRYDGDQFDPPIGNFEMRGGSSGSGLATIIEIDDPRTDYSTYTNLATGTLTMWSENGERVELSILSGHVEAGVLNLPSAGLTSINMRDGILHGGSWINLYDMTINMLEGGTGEIIVDNIDNIGAGGIIMLNFESGNRGRFTLDNNNGAPASGQWEWMIDNGHVFIDGVVNSNRSSYVITYEAGDYGGTIRLPGALTPAENYIAWVEGFGLVATNESGSITNDFDLDGLDNLTEYALGGNPIVPDADAINPTISGSVGSLEYLYNRRIDATFRGLTYGLTVTTDDLETGNWTSIGTVLETGSGAIDSAFEAVTNAIPTDTPIGFVNLEVTENF